MRGDDDMARSVAKVEHACPMYYWTLIVPGSAT